MLAKNILDCLGNISYLCAMNDFQDKYNKCPIRQVISKFGDKWSLLVLYSINASENGVLRFNELRNLMTDCSQKMLSATLKRLESDNLLCRKVYPVVPPKVEYLTPEEIIAETLSSVSSERTSRVIDNEAMGSMERRKREGYF